MTERNPETKTEAKTVFALTERNEKTFWTKIGAAFTNKDGSITVQLDALPVSGRLQIREDQDRDRDERSDRGDRKDRR
jgi:hypothetical protein